ncbi:MAG: S4 domain-containing protein [Acidobacteriota bacterium]
MKFVLPAESSLLEAIRVLIPGASNRTLRRMLEHGRVQVDGQTAKVASQRICAGAAVEVADQGESRLVVRGLKIVFEDNDLVLVEKPVGLLTVATAHERERTVYAYLRQYLKERSP